MINNPAMSGTIKAVLKNLPNESLLFLVAATVIILATVAGILFVTK